MLTKAEERLRHHASTEQASQFFDHVVFCTNVTYADGHFKADLTAVGIPDDELTTLSTQHELANAWKTQIPDFPGSNVHVLPSIEHAVRLVNSLNSKGGVTDILVTGSLHLVGGLIAVANLSSIAL